MSDLISREAAKNVLANLGIDIEDYWEDAIDGLPSVKPEKCGDCISRQAALDKWENTTLRGRTEFDQVIMMMPSVESCEDCVRRQDALEVLDDCAYDYESGNQDNAHTVARIRMCNLPHVTPERKTGKWVDGKCNRCGTHAPFWEMATTYYCSEYCPKCGAKMEVDGE